MSRLVCTLVYSRKAGSMMRKSILAYMADRAGDEGEGVWASKQRIANEIEASRGGVVENVKQMVEDGLLEEVGRRKHRNGYTMEYNMVLSKIAALPRLSDYDPPKKMTPTKSNGSSEITSRRNPGRHKPSLNRPKIKNKKDGDETESGPASEEERRGLAMELGDLVRDLEGKASGGR